MAWRTGHGTGKGEPRIEVLPPDELPSASGATSVRADRGADGRFVAGNRSGFAKRVRPGQRGTVDPSSSAFRPFKRWGRREAARRRRELATLHGGELSAGVSNLVESAYHELANARFCQAQGEETGNVDLFKQAGAHSERARQHELAAWELASREAAAKPKAKRPWDKS